ncbi:DUF3006 domain-containing protein [Desnuesiella massiliensis]|uniref:DUF3006 domain-containing protein n=1 Tax=Desnuesiella massiliensis TaxID=1650662 RepID=UPI0006E30B07|nr:DUF3006 domain-containing protein [Desnuesiella massiliensis]
MGENLEVFIVDRIEEHSIVCENSKGEIISICKNQVEGNPKEGEVLIKGHNKYHVDIEATKQRKAEIEELMKGMWADE